MNSELQTTKDWANTAFDKFEASLNGEKNSFFHPLRKKALSSLVKQDLPSKKNEAWKYTRADVVRSVSANSNLDFDSASLSELDFSTLKDSHKLIFVNGKFVEAMSSYSPEDGVVVRALSDVMSDDGSHDLVNLEKYIGKIANHDDDAFVALNTAFATEGAYISVAKNKKISKPVELIFATTEEASNHSSHPRVVIVGETGSEANIIERFVSFGSTEYMTTVVTEIALAENTNFNHYKLQLESDSAYHVSHVYADIKSNSCLKTFQFAFGGSTVRNEVWPVIDGEGVWAHLYGLSVLRDKQHVDNYTVINHSKPNSESNELYKGIYADKSRGIFNGTIIVEQDAQKTNAIQSNQSLLLSSDATSISRPQLKIWADDVKCTHGATIGQLDEDGLFYLLSLIHI